MPDAPSPRLRCSRSPRGPRRVRRATPSRRHRRRGARAAARPARAEGVRAPGRSGHGRARPLPPGYERARRRACGEVAPGIGAPLGLALDASSPSRTRTPGLHVEVAPPLHPLLDTAQGLRRRASLANDSGLDGTGVLVGIADTGIDVTHPDFLDAQRHTRVAWLLDLSAPPLGKHPDLEQQYGSTDSNGNVVARRRVGGEPTSTRSSDGTASQLSQLPQDEVGHGTLVAACAAGNGEQGRSAYMGVAPKATLVVARIYPQGGGGVLNDQLLSGVKFLFDRADRS